VRIVPLVEALDAAEFGGKAFNLGAALRAGLPVPPGYAVSVVALEAIARSAAATLADQAAIVRRCAGATCSICGNEIMDRANCEHVPGELYDEGLCEFAFSGITNVLEASLVFAGGQKGTQTFIPAERGLGAVELIDEPGFSRWDLIAEQKRVLAQPAARALQKRTTVQSVICARSRFDSASEAAAWVRDHDFRADKTDEGGDVFRFRQFDPGDCGDGSFRTIDIDAGVTAVICKKKERERVLSLEELLAKAE